MIKETVAYITRDGEIHKTLQKAKDHQVNLLGYWLEIKLKELAGWDSASAKFRFDLVKFIIDQQQEFLVALNRFGSTVEILQLDKEKSPFHAALEQAMHVYSDDEEVSIDEFTEYLKEEIKNHQH